MCWHAASNMFRLSSAARVVTFGVVVVPVAVSRYSLQSSRVARAKRSVTVWVASVDAVGVFYLVNETPRHLWFTRWKPTGGTGNKDELSQ